MTNEKEKRNEAVKRMETLGITNALIQNFEKKDIKYVSRNDFAGCIQATSEELKYICDFEIEYDALVYFCNYTPTAYGEMYTMFYVSNYPEEWKDTYRLFEYNEDYAYVYNKTYEECSEIGCVGFKVTNGILFRTY